MIATLLALGFIQKVKAFDFVPVSNSAQIQMIESSKPITPPLDSLPAHKNATTSELVLGGRSLGLVSPRPSFATIIGFDSRKRPYYAVESSASGAYTVFGSVPIVPTASGYKAISRFKGEPLVDVTDIGPKGELAIVLRKSFPFDRAVFDQSFVPVAGILSGDDWQEIGRAVDLKLGAAGTVGGITQLPSPTGSFEEHAIVRKGSEFKDLGKFDEMISTADGGFIFWQSTHFLREQESPTTSSNLNPRTISYLDGKISEVDVPKGYRPVAGWSKGRLVLSRESEFSFWLQQEGKLVDLFQIVALPRGMFISEANRAYPDGSLWVSGLTGTHKSWDAWLIPRKLPRPRLTAR